MARFSDQQSIRTRNEEGAASFRMSDNDRLATLLLNSFLGDSPYKPGSEAVEDLVYLVRTIPDVQFIARAAVVARTIFDMRSTSHAVAAELGSRPDWKRARYMRDIPNMRAVYSGIAQRPDDVCEILAYYLSRFGRPIPNSMKRGLGDALSSFDEYQLGKYRGGKRYVSLVDAVNLCHPKHTDAIGKLMNGTLRAPLTWEVLLSEAGKVGGGAEAVAKAKGAAWDIVVQGGKIGYMALLRNLRNIIEYGSDETVSAACETLTDPARVAKARVFPFRYFSAKNAIVYKLPNRSLRIPGIFRRVEQVSMAIDRAAEVALGNFQHIAKHWPGRTLVAVDGSGSMLHIGRGGVPMLNAASMFAAALAYGAGADVILFSDHAQYVSLLGAHARDAGIMRAAERIVEYAPRGGTNASAVFDKASHVYSRIFILSDEQTWVDGGTVTRAAGRYREISPDVKIYSINLSAYGTSMFAPDGAILLAGLSKNMLAAIPHVERAGGISQMIAEYPLGLGGFTLRDWERMYQLPPVAEGEWSD